MHFRIPILASMVVAIVPSIALGFVDGIDVSKWQGTINWNSVEGDGIDYAFVKATEGVNYVDNYFHTNMQGATAAGVYVGPYHFTRLESLNGVPFTSYSGGAFAPGSDPYVDAVSEANDFLDAIMPYYDTGLYLPPVADVESFPDFGNSALEKEFTSNWVQLFSDTINDTLGRRPIIYTGKYSANTRFSSAVASSHELWLAWWRDGTVNDPPVQSDTPLWNLWEHWQYTATGSVNGVSGNVDRDVFNGTLAQLEQTLIGYSPSEIVNITDFEEDEGYFGWAPTYSGSNQGVGSASTADRVTTEAHQGIGSQQIYVEGDAGGWFLRHLSGIGAAANPSGNLELDATGYVGFWLKTSDPGISVQIAVDDPDTADRGVAQSVIADGEWHLYEWDFDDDSQWEAWVNEEGIITGPTVTIDSIQFSGSGDATFFLDTISHNPLGSLGPIPGDFDGDGDVDADDLTQWEGDFGINGDSDADGDGDSDGGDFLAWQRNYDSPATEVLAAAVPEPASAVLLILGFLVVPYRNSYRRMG